MALASTVYWCPTCGSLADAEGVCPRCQSALGKVIRGGVVEMPPGSLPCLGCGRDDRRVHFRGWSRLYSFLWWSKEARYSGYLCRECGHTQTTISLFMSALLGWWSVPAFLFYGWRTTYYNWRSVWRPPGDPLAWGAIALQDLLNAADQETAEAAHFDDSPLASLTIAERHVVMSVEDPYGTLRVTSTSSDTEIRASWRELAKQTHPDVNPGDSEAAARMLALNQAYEVLRDERLRRAYDWLVVNGREAA